jgi:DNA polymerase I-like protein with 3'-5' exonuclease and polymerase domains
LLTFWTDADTSTFQDVVKDSLAGLEPKVQIRKYAFKEGEVLFPEQGEVVVAMGAPAVAELQKAGQVPKNRALTSLRETVVAYKLSNTQAHLQESPPSYGHWMFSYSPNSVFVEADKRSQVAWDARLAHRFYTTGSLEPVLGTYAWTDTLKWVIEYVKEKYAETQKVVSVALDLETMGLVPWFDDKKIVSIQCCVHPGYADAVYLLDDCWQDKKKWAILMEEVRWLLTSPMVALTGANLKFDILWMWVKWGIRPLNFKMDTLLVGSLLDENRSNSLKQHAKEYTKLGGYELPLEKWFKANKLDKGRMEMVPKDQLLNYAAPDADVTLQVNIYERKELQRERGLQRFYVKLLHPAVRAFEAVEYRGLCVDMKEFHKLETELTAEIAGLETVGQAMMPARLRAKYAGTGDMFRPAVMKDFFFSEMGMNLKPILRTPKTNEPKTDKAHFMMFREHPVAGPFLEVYSKLNSAKKTKSTYVDGFLNHLRPDGRFHPTYMLFNGSAFEGDDDDGGTDTGRLSAVDPAVQTIPKHTVWAKKLRKCYPAPPGYRFFQADFSQGELRLAACAANDETMIDAYLTGKDLHCVTGAKLAGLEFEEFMAHDCGKKKEQCTKAELQALELFAKFRQRAKPANFGLLYGMQAEGFRAYAYLSTDGKMDLSLEEAAEVRDAFFALYSKLLAWHKEQIDFANENGFVENPLGRIAHLPLVKSKIWKVKSKAERKAINSPIQSTLSDLCSWSIAVLEERWADEGLWIAGMTHDSIYGYYPGDDAQLWGGRIVEGMETLPYREVFDWHPQLDFPADFEDGLNMADLEKVKVKSQLLLAA